MSLVPPLVCRGGFLFHVADDLSWGIMVDPVKSQLSSSAKSRFHDNLRVIRCHWGQEKHRKLFHGSWTMDSEIVVYPREHDDDDVDCLVLTLEAQTG